MPNDSRGHHPDKSFPKVAINEELWKACQKLIPESWYAWEKACRQLMTKYKVPGSYPHFMGRVPDLSGKYKQGLRVFLADGNRIMIRHDMDFTQGANGWEDEDLCAKDEIILDSNILLPMTDDLPLIAYHEGFEGSGEMAKGLNYDQAHEKANAAERMLRIRSGVTS